MGDASPKNLSISCLPVEKYFIIPFCVAIELARSLTYLFFSLKRLGKFFSTVNSSSDVYTEEWSESE